MAFSLLNFTPTVPVQSSKPMEKPITQSPLSTLFSPSSLAALQSSSPPLPAVMLAEPTTSPQDRHQTHDDFYVNLGVAVRTLREDLPLIFSKDLDYRIYRDDVTFSDSLNTFTGIENYKLIFQALRFHSRILFCEISLELCRVWQPSEKTILIRWNLRALPRVPWEAKGEFQGTSRYKLDRNAKIYEHKVDNLALNFPKPFKPAASVLDLLAACPASPNPMFFCELPSLDAYPSSWLRLYEAVNRTLDQERYLMVQDGLVT